MITKMNFSGKPDWALEDVGVNLEQRDVCAFRFLGDLMDYQRVRNCSW